MMGDMYIQAVRTTGYICSTSGKKTAKVEISRPTPKENIRSSSMDNGSSKSVIPKGTRVTSKIRKSGTNESTKLTMLAKMVETTKDDLGR